VPSFAEVNADLFTGPEVSDHDPLLVAFSWGVLVPGPIPWRAHYLAREDGAVLEQKPDLAQEVGVWGETCLVPLTDKTGRFTVRFLPNSPTVTLLEAALAANRLSLRLGGPANAGALTITDLNSPARGAFVGSAALEGPCSRWTLSSGVYIHEYAFLCDGVESFLSSLL
jgi:hypothetical protein